MPIVVQLDPGQPLPDPGAWLLVSADRHLRYRQVLTVDVDVDGSAQVTFGDDPMPVSPEGQRWMRHGG